MRALFVSLVITLLLAAGCGDDVDDASKTNAQKYCEARCGWNDGCGKGSADCASKCISKGSAYYNNFWSDAFAAAYSTCLSSLDCKSSDDSCLMEAFKAVAPGYPNVTLVQDCLAKRKSCGDSFHDDYCMTLVGLTAAYQTQAAACAKKPCGELEKCLGAAGAFKY